jgi:hypothetical protein
MARKRRFRFGLPIVLAGRRSVGGVGPGCQPSGQVPPVKATFDTNTLSGVIDPDRQFGAADLMAYQAAHGAVKMGQIRVFFSERPTAFGVSLVPLSFRKAP